MKIAIIAPSPIPFALGGAENVYSGLFQAIGRTDRHQAELVKAPIREGSFWDLISAYSKFAGLDVSHFDSVISLKYPAWSVPHRNHIVYMQHKLRGLYDTYAHTGLSTSYKSNHTSIRKILDLIEDPRSFEKAQHEVIVHLFGLLSELNQDMNAPSETFAFPGPFIRKIVHFIDRVSLSKDAIASFNAISRTVVRRPSHFPLNVPVKVIYHPTNLAIRPKNSGNYFFTVSRLEKAKRIDLLINAFKLSGATQDFVIAGSGPDRDYFEILAAGDPRIKFVGRLSDADLISYYGNSIAVLFAPYDEDFGLIALEAMGSAKPVITTDDAGGPTELVRHGETGYVCPPTAMGIAVAISVLAENPHLALDIGENARASVAHITWDNLLSGLLDEVPEKRLERSYRSSMQKVTSKHANHRVVSRRSVLVITTFGGASARSGGPLRLFNLYSRMAQYHDITMLVLGGHAGRVSHVMPGYVEIHIPVSADYLQKESDISRDVDWVPVSDVAFSLLYKSAPEYLDAVKRFSSSADLIVLEHPFLWPAVSGVTNLDDRLILDSHNVETLLKQDIYPTTRRGRELLSVVHSVEAEAAGHARIVLTCSDEDKSIFQGFFKTAPSKIWVVPNGVDCQNVKFTAFENRPLRRVQLGIFRKEPIAYFIGSWHGPNISAAQRVIECARSLNDVRFVIAGSVGDALRSVDVTWPDNVVVTGKIDVETNLELLSMSNLALNPMSGGSGTNLKIFEYAAAGTPILSTSFGVRGTELKDGRHLELAPISAFEEGIISAMVVPVEMMADRVRQARVYVENNFDWNVIFDKFNAKLGASFV